MRPRTLRALSLMVVLLGAVAMVPPQFAFLAVDADRAAAFQVVDDTNGYLGIVDNSGTVGTVDKDAQAVYYLDDNAGGSFDAAGITASIVGYANCTSGSTAACPSVDVSPSSDGHDFEVVVSCDGTDIKATDTMTISLRAEGSGVVVDAQRTTTSQVSTNCKGNTGGGGGGFSAVSAGNVTTGGATQSVTFSLNGTAMQNQESVTIDLSDATGVDYSNAQVDAGNAGAANFVDADTIEFSPSGKLKTTETVTLSVTNYSVTDAGADPWTATFSRSDATGYDSDDFYAE